MAGGQQESEREKHHFEPDDDAKGFPPTWRCRICGGKMNDKRHK